MWYYVLSEEDQEFMFNAEDLIRKKMLETLKQFRDHGELKLKLKVEPC